MLCSVWRDKEALAPFCPDVRTRLHCRQLGSGPAVPGGWWPCVPAARGRDGVRRRVGPSGRAPAPAAAGLACPVLGQG